MRMSRWFLIVGIALIILVTVHLWGGGDFSGVSVGAAAIIGALVTAVVALNKAYKVEKTLNGGLSSMAAQIMHDELRVAGFEVGLNSRVEFLEAHYTECLEREIAWEEERTKIREDRVLLRDLMAKRLKEEEERRD